MKRIFALLCLAGLLVSAQAKRELNHDDFDGWKSVRLHSLSNNGEWATYTVNPQQGDGELIVRNVQSGKQVVIPRGADPVFLGNSRWLLAKVRPLYADTRKAKIDKKKDLDKPQDSLAIVNLRTMNVEKVANVLSFKTGKDAGAWVAYASCDTAYAPLKGLKDKKSGKPLVVRDLESNTLKIVPWVKGYTFSRDGSRLAYHTEPWKGDTLAVSHLALLNLPDTVETMLLKGQKFYGSMAFSDDSRRFAFKATMDSAETGTRRYDAYTVNLTDNAPSASKLYLLQAVNEGKMPHIMQPRITDESKRDSIMADMRKRLAAMAGDSIFVNQYSPLRFSKSGNRLIVGVARQVAPDDTTIVDFEQPELDIWRWDAPLTPPQELKNLSDIREHTMPIVYDLTTDKQQLLTDSELTSVKEANHYDADWALLRDPREAIISQQWDYAAPEELYAINVLTGEKRHAGTAPIENSAISPAGKYIYWYTDRNYFVYDIEGDTTVCVSTDVPYPLWDEDQDIPLERQPYGIMGWSENDGRFLVYDRYDIWSLDPSGKTKPVNLTDGAGRKQNMRYRYQATDDELIYVPAKGDLLLRLFDYTSKKHGFASMKGLSKQAPKTLTLEDKQFYQLRKAKNAPAYGFAKGNFTVIPDIYLTSNGNFAGAKKVTDTDAQRADINWGNAQLVDWYAYDGRPSQGILYTPENLDPNKKYPMLVVFYERSTEELYRHYTMEPSWSWVNYPFYVSRGYVIFVPDVHYYTGIPGESAYNYICSGVQDLCKRYPWIDEKHIGIDGQSWGGYQTAYLVTRTNMFACAGSGAPVSNMTSAFGGIRWESGDSRQAQYEVGQSRVGRNLWEAPELYIANSPIFKADRVNTPLLIMHNDADGAVPWYQGIEYFMALRRLGKPVWMLQYNSEAHNLKARKNRKDITHRLQEFFDHYLKDAPMPLWMKEGIPVLRKGQILNYGE